MTCKAVDPVKLQLVLKCRPGKKALQRGKSHPCNIHKIHMLINALNNRINDSPGCFESKQNTGCHGCAYLVMVVETDTIFAPYRSFGIIEIEGDDIRAEIIKIDEG